MGITRNNIMIVDNVNKDFEQWYSDDGKDEKCIEKTSTGNYKLLQTHLAWVAWAAASLVYRK